jgi:hypothetical protein
VGSQHLGPTAQAEKQNSGLGVAGKNKQYRILRSLGRQVRREKCCDPEGSCCDPEGSLGCPADLGAAETLGKLFFPLVIEDCPIDGILSERHSVSVFREGDAAYERLWKSLEQHGLGPHVHRPWPPLPALRFNETSEQHTLLGRLAEELASSLMAPSRAESPGKLFFSLPPAASSLIPGPVGKSRAARFA